MNMGETPDMIDRMKGKIETEVLMIGLHQKRIKIGQGKGPIRLKTLEGIDMIVQGHMIKVGQGQMKQGEIGQGQGKENKWREMEEIGETRLNWILNMKEKGRINHMRGRVQDQRTEERDIGVTAQVIDFKLDKLLF